MTVTGGGAPVVRLVRVQRRQRPRRRGLASAFTVNANTAAPRRHSVLGGCRADLRVESRPRWARHPEPWPGWRPSPRRRALRPMSAIPHRPGGRDHLLCAVLPGPGWGMTTPWTWWECIVSGGIAPGPLGHWFVRLKLVKPRGADGLFIGNPVNRHPGDRHSGDHGFRFVVSYILFKNP